MTTFPKYDRYKDSGVEWLGEIRRGKSIFRIVLDKQIDCNIRIFTEFNDILSRLMKFQELKESA
ncbi:MAG: hypothetical protein O2964_12715 [Verrucomicrobia bacterium]|jgi:hypothetical protein|nr:hypothetical protein [Verrucomicrobiota bacterium]